MIIKNKNNVKELPVYSIYWVNGSRYYLVIPYDGYGGFLAVSENDWDVIDASLDGFLLRKSENAGDLLLHNAADDGDLFDRLIDHDEQALEIFYKRLRVFSSVTNRSK